MSSYHCGIDVGRDNLSIVFLSADRTKVVIYLGSTERMIRLAVGHEPIAITVDHPTKTPSGEQLVAMLDAIPEFGFTARQGSPVGGFLVEMQMGSQSFAKCDGIIFGYLRGKGIPGHCVSSTLRVNLASWLVEQGNMHMLTMDDIKELTKEEGNNRSTGRKVPETKIPPMSFVRHMYPAEFNMIVSSGMKLDDMCDALFYAHMSLHGWCNAKAVTAMKRCIAKAAKPATKRASRSKKASLPVLDDSDDDDG